MGKPERTVAGYLLQQVEKRGGFLRKYQSPGRRGVPDYIVFLPMRIIFVETKTEKGNLSRLQKEELNRIGTLGIPAAVVNRPIEVDVLMKAYDDAVAHMRRGIQ